MRRSILSILIVLCLSWPAAAQDPNPQGGFAPTVLLANPSLYLNFNDTTAAFKDQISGQSFTNSFTTSGSTTTTFATPTFTDPGVGNVIWNSAALTTGSLTSVSIQFYTAPASGQSLTFLIGSAPSSDSITILSSFTVTPAATTAIQTFTAPTNFTAVSVTAGEVLGIWSKTVYAGASAAGTIYYSGPFSSLPSGAVTYNTAIEHMSYGSVVTGYTTYTSGTVTPRQPGFDSTLLNNTSAEFPWNGWNVAPNNTLGAIEWNTPWSMMLQVDRLNWSRTGTLVLASKGDLATGTFWYLYLQMNGMLSQLCFSSRGQGAVYAVGNGVCSDPAIDAMPNGFNYNIVVENSGTGGNGVYYPTGSWSAAPALSLYINGLSSNNVAIDYSIVGSGFNAVSFGDVNVSVAGGTGYPSQTAFTSTGGGANCHVSGVMWSTGGVPYNTGANWFPNISQNYGCTSVPTLSLASSSGTGAVLTVALDNSSMNSTNFPSMVPGYVNSGIFYGVAGTASTQNPTYLDEFAIFPGNLNQTQVQSLFYWTKFYQSLLYPTIVPSVSVPKVIMDVANCGGDPSGDYQVIMTLAAHNLHLIELVGVVDSDLTPFPGNSVGWYRQVLDEYGLANVPLTIGPGSQSGVGNGNCPASDMNLYNASTPQDPASYSSSTPMYRKIFAGNPTTPIIVTIGQYLNAYAAFLESPADSISPLTGLQLQAQNAANGGWVNVQANPGCGVAPQISPCTYGPGVYAYINNFPTGAVTNVMANPTAAYEVMQNNGTTPIYFMQASPQGSTPLAINTRTSNDPVFHLLTRVYQAQGDTYTPRPGFNTQQIAQVLSPFFWGGVQVTYSAGTGYANSTPFTSTGGGPTCHVQGIMTASGGVPNGITTVLGQAVTGNWKTLGYGCTSSPTLVLTSPTGNGVTLNAYTTQFCFTDEIAQVSSTPPSSSWSETYTSATCSNQYLEMPSEMAVGGDWGGGFSGASVFTWFQNSLTLPPPQTRPLYAH
jgi:hypothetical protein